MDTIQLQCGSCGQMMAIATAHLGSQVQCPHCRAVVQTPRAPAPAASPPSLSVPDGATVEMTEMERESIFGQPEPSDDLFGGGSPPRIEMPPPPPEPLHAPTVTMEEAPEPSPEPTYQPSYQPTSSYAPSGPAEEELATIAPRSLPKRSTFVPTLLIFLIPYAIFTTAFIGYLLYNWPRDNPLKRLPDNVKSGQPRQQVRHDLDLDADMKVALGQSIRVGDIEVTPVRVKHTGENDLVLVFRAKNLSGNLLFNPIADEYVRYSSASMAAGKPYTFLARRGERDMAQRAYGGNLEWLRGSPPRSFDGEIGPGQEAIIHLITDAKERKRLVPRLVKTPDPLVWRIQVRRGLVPADDDGMVSATTVIGIEFTARDILKEASNDDTDNSES